MTDATEETRRAYRRAYYIANREKLLAAQRTRREKDPAAEAAYQRAYRAANKEKLREYAKKRSHLRNGNPDKLAYNRKYYAENKERYKENGRAWVEAHRDKANANGKRWKDANREQVRAASRAAYAAAKEAHRIRRIAKNEEMLRRKRPEACEVCGGNDGGIVFDHCHQHGHARGWLCGHCNTALGLIRDSPDRLLKLAAYLRRTKARTAPQLVLPV